MILEKDVQIQVEERWLTAADEMLAWGWSVEEQADLHGLVIAKNVLAAGGCEDQTIVAANLRTETNNANKLDGEIFAMSGGDIDSLEANEREIAYAVRIWHHSGKLALDLVGTHSRRIRTRIALHDMYRCIQKQSGQGLDAMKEHDLSASLILSRIKRR